MPTAQPAFISHHAPLFTPHGEGRMWLPLIWCHVSASGGMLSNLRVTALATQKKKYIWSNSLNDGSPFTLKELYFGPSCKKKQHPCIRKETIPRKCYTNSCFPYFHNLCKVFTVDHDSTGGLIIRDPQTCF